MPKLVVHGASLRCREGLSSATLTVLPSVHGESNRQPTGTVMDFQPFVNIPPFGLCKTQTNPQVAAATVAAQGVLTPQPCIPMIPSPWLPGATVVMIDHKKALTDNSTCQCVWAGTIEVVNPNSQIDVE